VRVFAGNLGDLQLAAPRGRVRAWSGVSDRRQSRRGHRDRTIVGHCVGDSIRGLDISLALWLSHRQRGCRSRAGGRHPNAASTSNSVKGTSDCSSTRPVARA